MTFAARIPTFASGDPYAGSLLATDFTRKFYKAPGFVGSDFSSLPGLTVTRATPAVSYAQTSGGVLVPFAANTARITDQGLLVEEARTNLALQSADFSNASWIKNGATTATAAATTAPDGTLTASKLAEATTTLAAHDTTQTVTVVASSAYTFSVYIKAEERTQAEIQLFDGGSVNQFPVVDLTTGAVVTANGATVTSKSLTNGWWRFSFTATPATTSLQVHVYPASGGANSYAGTVGSGIYVWGAQVELGAFPTSYIPTTSASATRAADVDKIGSLSDFTSGDFTLVYSVQGVPAQTGKFPAPFAFNDGSGANQLQSYLNGGASATEPNVKEFRNSVSIFDTPAGTGTTIIGGAVNTAITKSGTAVRGTSGGTTPNSLGTWTAMGVALTTLELGQSDVGNNRLNGYLKKLLVYPRAFSDAELIAATT